MQADRTLDRSGGGLGLGLALVKGLVELQGGEVSASSAGPARAPSSSSGSRWRRRRRFPSHPPRAARRVPPLRVLVVEDDADIA